MTSSDHGRLWADATKIATTAATTLSRLVPEEAADEHTRFGLCTLECPEMLDMRVIFTDIPAGLRDLPPVETEGSAWLLLIRV